MKDNWQSKVASPYNDWDNKQLTSFLKQKGVETKDVAESNKDGLISQVKSYWYEAEDKAEDAWSSVRDWVFDSWTGKLAETREAILKSSLIFSQILNSLLSLIIIISLFHIQESETLFFKRFVQATTLLPRRLVKLLPTLVTGSMRLGLNLVCIQLIEVLYH